LTVATTPGVIEIRIDVRPLIAAMERFTRDIQAAMDRLPYLPGLQALATASDLTVAARHGEVACTGVHEALPPSGCPFCGAAL
jgi:hypothetical protein